MPHIFHYKGGIRWIDLGGDRLIFVEGLGSPVAGASFEPGGTGGRNHAARGTRVHQLLRSYACSMRAKQVAAGSPHGCPPKLPC
jgi:hypothetical protein